MIQSMLLFDTERNRKARPSSYFVETNCRNQFEDQQRDKSRGMTIGVMEVTLINARGLNDTEFFFGGIDPYVLIQYNGQECKSSVARGQGSNPRWNEKFRFRAEYPGGNDDYKLILKIMDHDTFSSDDYLGQATIYLRELLQFGVGSGKAELHPTKYTVVSGDLSYSGEIQVGVTFIPKERMM